MSKGDISHSIHAFYSMLGVASREAGRPRNGRACEHVCTCRVHRLASIAAGAGISARGLTAAADR